MMKGRTFLLLAAPGVLLGLVGATHPSGLRPDTAEHWFWMHVAGVLVFPLVGVALAWLVRGRRDLLAIGIVLAAYVYATFYTALDVISGIGNGYVTAELGEDAVPRPPAIWLAFRIGTMLGDIGAWALLLAAVLITIDTVRRRGLSPVALAPCALLLTGSFFLRPEHIFWPWGSLSCIAIGVGTGWLGVVLQHDAARPLRTSTGPEGPA
ncbi:MAG: hypothetical protein WA903_00515 [Ornithinimicrobium sp.]